MTSIALKRHREMMDKEAARELHAKRSRGAGATSAGVEGDTTSTPPGDSGAAGGAGAPPSPPPVATGSAVIQFVSMGEGTATGPRLDVPMSSTPAQLEQVLNALSPSEEPQPYTFYLNDAEMLGDVATELAARGLSSEEVHTIRYQPLAVFRVRPVTRCTDTLPGHGAAVLHVSFSPDGQHLASGGGDMSVRFWDTGTCTPRVTCTGHRHHVLVTAWSPDGRFFASGDRAGEVRVWDPETGEARGGPLVGHAEWITSMAWEPLHSSPSRQCELLATSSKDKTVTIWNVVSGRRQATISGHTDSIESVRWGGNGLIFTASRDRTVKVWTLTEDRAHVKLVRTLAGHGHRVNSLALNTDHLCRTGPFDHRGAVHTTADAAFEAAAARYSKGLAEMGGRELLVSCSDDFTLFLWDPADTKKAVVRMTGHQAAVNHLSFSPDGRYIASASFDKKVKLWDGHSGKFLVTYVGHVLPVYQVVWSADSRYIASASKDSTIKLWSAKARAGAGGTGGAGFNSKAVGTLPGHADEVYALDWSPDGAMVASGSKDWTIKIWRN